MLIQRRIDYSRAEAELNEFKRWLDDNPVFSARIVVSELRKKTDLCLLIQLAAGRGCPDCYKHEFALHGVFRADLVIGSTTERHFVLVEFKGGMQDSLFRQTKRAAQLRDWSSQLQHAFSQVSDWTWAENDNQHSDIYRNAFGMPHMSETYLIVCGRSAFLDPIDRSRLHWRSEKTAIASCNIRFWTYDDLYANSIRVVATFNDVMAAARDAP